MSPTVARDAALGRISRTRRWMLAGAAALTAGLAALASALLPGKSLGAKPTTVAATAARTGASRAPVTPQLPSPASSAQLGLNAPGQAPQSAPAPQPAPAPAPAQAAPQPAPAPSGGGTVVSGGS